MADVVPREVERWMLMSDPESDALMIILVVDDTDDDELTAVIAREAHVPAEHFAGVWESGEREGYWLVAFMLIELGGGIERKFVSDNIHRELLDAILDVPHLVAIMPSEIAGDASSAEAVAPRLGSAVIVEVTERSPQVAKIRGQRRD